MKKLIMGLLAGIVLCGATTSAFAAIEVSGDAYVGVYSKYVWRGFDVFPADDYSLQGGTDVSFKGLTIGWWGAYEEDNSNLTEVDLVIDYSRDFGEMVSASIGNIHYAFGGASTNELYAGATLNTLLSPSLTVYWDYDTQATVYTTLGISHDLDIADKTTLGLGAQVSYFSDSTKSVFASDESWFHNAELSAAVSYAVNDQVSIDASLLYSGPLTDDARTIAGIREEYTGGVSTTLSF